MMNSDNKITNHFFKNQVSFLKENYDINDSRRFEQFKTAVEMYCYFVFEMDKLIDGEYNFFEQYKSGENKIHQLTQCHQNSLKLLTGLFPRNHPFWNDFEDNSKKYSDILLKEKYENIAKSILSENDFKEYAVAKHCLAYIPVRGLSYLFEGKAESKELEKIFTNIFLGMQMNDDIEDFDSDLNESQWTYAHSRVEEFMKENGIGENSGLDKFRERVLYVSGIGEELTHYAKDSFMTAKSLCKKNHLTNLEHWLENAIAIIEENEKLILRLTSN